MESRAFDEFEIAAIDAAKAHLSSAGVNLGEFKDPLLSRKIGEVEAEFLEQEGIVDHSNVFVVWFPLKDDPLGRVVFGGDICVYFRRPILQVLSVWYTE